MSNTSGKLDEIVKLFFTFELRALFNIWVIPQSKKRNAAVVATTADKLGKRRWWFVYRAEGLKLSKIIKVVAGLSLNIFKQFFSCVM